MRRMTIGLLWHTWNSANRGVDALTRANIAIIRAAGSRAGVIPQFVLLGIPSGITPDEEDIRVGPYLRPKRLLMGDFGYFAALARCDVVFDIGEGDSFSDIYGTFRFLFLCATKLCVLWVRKALVLSPQTIGPFKHAWTGVIAAYLMRRSRLVFSRDGSSTKLLADLDIRENAAEAIDVAFRLPFTRQTPAHDGTLRIGINVSGLMYYEGSRFGLKLDYRGLTHELIKVLLQRPNVEVWLVPHVFGRGLADDDVPVSKYLCAEYPALRIAPYFANAADAKSFISGLHFFIGGRMHACIAAYASGVPVVPVAYSRKFTGLFRTLSYSRVIDATAQNTVAGIRFILQCLDELVEMRCEIKPGLVLAQQRLALYEDKVVELLAALPGEKHDPREDKAPGVRGRR